MNARRDGGATGAACDVPYVREARALLAETRRRRRALAALALAAAALAAAAVAVVLAPGVLVYEAR
jgi:ferric-dicitrate binding protein FerR (iron transport regulator)